MICAQTKVHIPNFNSSSFITMKRKAKYSFRAVAMLLLFYKNITLYQIPRPCIDWHSVLRGSNYHYDGIIDNRTQKITNMMLPVVAQFS